MKILMLTLVYRQPDDYAHAPGTDVVGTFCRHWVAMGHEVVAIVNQSRYPLPYYMIPARVQRALESRLNYVSPRFCQRREAEFMDGGVRVHRMPFYRLIPHGVSSARAYRKHADRIRALLKKLDFVPDVMLGHWENPQIQLLTELQKDFPVPTAAVFHGLVYIANPKYTRLYEELLQKVSLIGFRSQAIRREYEARGLAPHAWFDCPSGVPDRYVTPEWDEARISAPGPLTRYLYAGLLMRRKRVDALIEGVALAKGDAPFALTIAGEGVEGPQLIAQCAALGIGERTTFVGRLGRDELQARFAHAQCFIMISEDEVFGLVYMEAMAQGCLVVASGGGGMEGIIRHGENGFLCAQGDARALAAVLAEIDGLPPERRLEIARAARETARRYTDSRVSEQYLERVLQGSNGR